MFPSLEKTPNIQGKHNIKLLSVNMEHGHQNIHQFFQLISNKFMSCHTLKHSHLGLQEKAEMRIRLNANSLPPQAPIQHDLGHTTPLLIGVEGCVNWSSRSSSNMFQLEMAARLLCCCSQKVEMRRHLHRHLWIPNQGSY